MITAFALTLGAQFWFDLLKRLISIRGVGEKPEETKPLPRTIQSLRYQRTGLWAHPDRCGVSFNDPWKPQYKLGSTSNLGVQLNHTFVTIHHVFHDRQPQPSSSRSLARGEERLKNSFHIFGIDPTASIRNLTDNLRFRAARHDVDLTT